MENENVENYISDLEKEYGSVCFENCDWDKILKVVEDNCE